MRQISGPITHPHIVEELADILITRQAPYVEATAEPFIPVSARTHPQTVITIPANCDVKNAPLDFSQAVARFFRYTGVNEPTAEDLKIRVREFLIILTHLQGVIADVKPQRDEEILSGALRSVQETISSKFSAVTKGDDKQYMEMLSQRYHRCAGMMEGTEKMVGSKDAGGHFSLARMAAALSEHVILVQHL
eukprot:Protomagalhaensia_sp_Gyna_25__7@NODE_1003_length_2306_cov_4_891045_g799_i0_p1_GENE_NODE_1003_length_2306_cov_4_891045_g799_i0NODE_1003_length_2306_cov_4_891045_g799_i0_p1_ORF_typecomplete_len192_score44_12_NODE_1003_length_2306_cov_4_891045_g799_i012951870